MTTRTPVRARESVRGIGLHSGKRCSVTLHATDGDVVFRTPRGDAKLEDVEIVRADHGVRIRCAENGLDADGVEHLLAALGGLSVRRGIAIEIDGGEVPLADGAAHDLARAVQKIGAAPSASRARILRESVIDVGASRYAFSPADSTSLYVEINFEAARIGEERANWDGSPAAFFQGVAWARTFGFARDAARLRASGRALGADPMSVMVLDDEGGVLPPGLGARPGEFARHKLLDLIGDLYLFGGPPIGSIRATRPGHAATHRAMAEALKNGVVVSENRR